MITFHIEAVQNSDDIKSLLYNIHEAKLNAGIALNPATSIEEVYPHLINLDHVLLMSVNPGFSGQTFIPSVITKIQPLASQRTTTQKSYSFIDK